MVNISCTHLMPLFPKLLKTNLFFNMSKNWLNHYNVMNHDWLYPIAYLSVFHTSICACSCILEPSTWWRIYSIMNCHPCHYSWTWYSTDFPSFPNSRIIYLVLFISKAPIDYININELFIIIVLNINCRNVVLLEASISYL